MARETGAPSWRDSIVRIRDERWRVERTTHFGEIELLTVRGCGTTNRAQTGAFLLPFDIVDRLDANDAPRAVSAVRWRREARRVLASAQPTWNALRAAAHANVSIIPFQLEPALAFAGGHGSRILLADAVGLGKTIQAGLLVAELHHRRPEARTLVVAPASLCHQWHLELTDRFSVAPKTFDAPGLARCRAQLQPGSNPWALTPIVITSIDFVKRPEVVRALESVVWDLVIFDEAHHLAGRSDRFDTARALGSRARTVVLLTATPHSGDALSYTRLCSIGALHADEPLLLFARSRGAVGLPHRRRDTRLHVRPTTAELAMHTALAIYARRVWAGTPRARATHEAGARLAMVVLMRRACSSARSLARTLTRRLALLSDPDSHSDRQLALPLSTEPVDDEPATGLDVPGLADPVEESEILQRLLLLAHEASRDESKPAALRRLITRAGEPAIVFTEYRDTLLVLTRALPGVACTELHGGLTGRQRHDALTRFTSGEAQVLLATDAAGEGLNLHRRCRLVISLELPWSPLRLEQRAGRVDRIGQTRMVHAIRFVARDTCEETTLARLEDRGARILSAAGAHGPPLTVDQVADRVLGDGSAPGQPESIGTAPDLVRISLGREAELEASRIVAARALEPCDTGIRREPQALVARLRRRTAPLALRHGVWAFRITLSTRSGQVVWEPLVTLAAELEPPPAPTHRYLRLVLNPEQPSIAAALNRVRADAVRTLSQSIRRPAQMWTRRERDIITHLRTQHARLSVTLSQRSLFGRDRERAAAAQATLLDAALSQCTARLHELHALDDIEAEAVRLAFAALVL